MCLRRKILVIKNLCILLSFLETKAFTQTARTILPPELQAGYSIPVPPGEHPRLFIRSGDIVNIKKNVESNELKAIWQRMVETSKDEKHSLLPKVVLKDKGNYDDLALRAAEAKALMFVFNSDTVKGRKAIDIMANVLQTVVFPPKQDITRKVGETIVTGAIVYDWCYYLMSDSEKNLFLQGFKKLAAEMEIGYPPVKQGGVVGHGSEAQLMRDLLSAGIAVYDEDKEIYTLSATRFFKEFVPVRNYWYRSEMHHQGDSYGPYRFQWEMFATWIFDRMGYKNTFNKQQAKVPYRWIYTRRPDGQLLRDGDSFLAAQTRLGTYWASPFHLMLASNYYKDPYLKYEFVKQYGLSLGRYRIEDIWMILFTDPKVRPAIDKNLPLTKYFDDPSATMVARTSWDTGRNSNAVVAEMKVGGIWFANHQHLDAGQFQIYYKGGLAIDAGIYEGTKGAYGSPHDANFHKRTIAHNTILVNDRNEEFIWAKRKLANDGGQRLPNNGYEPYKADTLFAKGYRVAKVLAHKTDAGNSPDYSYIKGELTKAYSAKVSGFNRSFVFLNLKNNDHPAAMVVFDRVTSAKEDFKKTWLLHSIEEPVIAGNVTTIKRTESGYSGKLINTTLLPVENNIEKIGGAGKEFEVNGTNYEQYVKLEGSSEEAGAWRIEVSPKAAAKTDLFLNVLQVSDEAKGTLPLETKLVETEKLAGTMIADRMILFSKEGGALTGSVPFNIPANSFKKTKVLIADLKAGSWSVRKPGGESVRQFVTKEAGTFYFEAPRGNYVLQVK